MSRRPRVLFITAAFPGAVDPGRANFVAQLARELSGKMDLVLLAPRIHRQDPPRERWAGIDVHRFPFISEGRLLKEYGRLPSLAGASYLVSGIREAAALAVRHSPDLILTHWVLPAGPIGLAASRLTGAPLVLNAHGSDINVYARQGRLFRSLAQRTLSAAAFTITASDSIRRQVVEEFGVPPGKVEVIPSGIDSAFLDGPPRDVAKKRIGIPEDSRLLLYVGDLTIAKGIPVAAKALEKIQEEDPSVWVCLVGRGPEGRRFAGRDRVILTGALPNRELPTYFRAADIFLFPSLSEGSPVSVMEALASGLPIVASEVGGVPDLVRDGQTGILVPPGDPARLESAIRSLLDDDSSRRAMASAAVSRGRDHLAAPRARKVEEVLRRVLRENGADPAAVYDRYWRTTRVDR
ncbi:MAG: glycosyltransferase, partial [Planctomycetota bacterium]|nr:glycosyltransferase [Planctomycetota bacterium]